jgi:hypothetical protein
VTTEPLRPSATISASRPKAPHKLVPVEAPTRRPSTALAWRAAAAASGTDTMRSTTSGRKDGSMRGLPIPSIRDDAEITM